MIATFIVKVSNEKWNGIDFFLLSKNFPCISWKKTSLYYMVHKWFALLETSVIANSTTIHKIKKSLIRLVITANVSYNEAHLVCCLVLRKCFQEFLIIGYFY